MLRHKKKKSVNKSTSVEILVFFCLEFLELSNATVHYQFNITSLTKIINDLEITIKYTFLLL